MAGNAGGDQSWEKKNNFIGRLVMFPYPKRGKINLVPIDEGKFIEPINGKEVNHEKMYVNHEKMQHEIKREE